MAMTTRRGRVAVHDARNAETIGIRDEIKPTELESLRDREYRHYVCSRSPCGPLRIALTQGKLPGCSTVG